MNGGNGPNFNNGISTKRNKPLSHHHSYPKLDNNDIPTTRGTYIPMHYDNEYNRNIELAEPPNPKEERLRKK